MWLGKHCFCRYHLAYCNGYLFVYEVKLDYIRKIDGRGFGSHVPQPTIPISRGRTEASVGQRIVRACLAQIFNDPLSSE